MKRTIFFAALCLLFGLTGCKEAAKVDVKKEASEDKSRNWEINVEKSVFSSVSPEMQKDCQAVNDRVQLLIDSLQQNIKIEADTFFTSYGKVSDERPEFSYQLYVRDSVFMATDKFISLRVLVYTYEGGAHGRTNFFAFNYDVKKKAFLKVQEIVDYSKADAINPLLGKYFNNESGCFSEKPELGMTGMEAVNVSPAGVCFTFGQYVLGAYACGYAQITIPLAGLEEAKALLLPSATF